MTAEELRRGLRAGTIAQKFHPTFCGSSLKNIGVQKLIDGVVDYLPSPLDRPPVEGWKSLEDHTAVKRRPRKEDPMAALVFKIVAEKPLDLYYLRVYSGVLKGSTR